MAKTRELTEEKFQKDSGGATLLNGKIYRIPATKDFMFKNLFGINGKEENLRHLLQAILKIEIESLVIQNPELPRSSKKDKKGILDVRAKLSNGTTCFIEMQVRDEHNLGERATFYICKLYANTMESGENYDTLEKAVAIIITDFSYFNRREYHQIAHLKFEKCLNIEELVDEDLNEDESELLTDKLELHIIDLKKFKKIKEPKGELADWLNLIIGNERGIMMASKKNEAIKKVNKENRILSKEKQMQEEYWFEQKERYAENTRISVATKQGIEIGREEGMKQGKEEGMKQGIEKGMKVGKKEEKIKIAKNLLNLGISIENIEMATGLTKKEIEAIDGHF